MFSSDDDVQSNYIRPFLIAILLTLIAIILQLLVLLNSIRRNLLQVFRGDNSEIPRRDAKLNVNYACQNIHFAGYLIGYVLWGYALLGVFAIVVVFLVNLVIVDEIVSLMELTLKIAIPPLLFAIFQYYLNKILGQYVFLQDSGAVLSINHRRIFMLFLYFNFFLDALLGFVSSIIRVLKSTIAAFVYMCRLDYSFFGRKLETFDAGFSAYCGFIHMECAHRHPILLYFISLLIREQLYGKEERHPSKAQRRWHLAVFLLKNPTLIYRRKQFDRLSQTIETKLAFIGRNHMRKIHGEDSPDVFYLQSTTA